MAKFDPYTKQFLLAHELVRSTARFLIAELKVRWQPNWELPFFLS